MQQRRFFRNAVSARACIEPAKVSNACVMLQLAAQLFQPTCQDGGVSWLRVAAMRRQTCWAVIHRIHAGNDSWQNLRGANIRRRFFAPNMLFACLQCESVRRVAVGVNADAN
jgi:hypothetical protein